MVFVARKSCRGGKGRAVDVIFDVAGYQACIKYSSGADCFFGRELGILNAADAARSLECCCSCWFIRCWVLLILLVLTLSKEAVNKVERFARVVLKDRI
jgi:hypothetical protein